MNEVWAIILAAGASTRMYQQKLLLPFQDKTIIETVIDHATLSVDKNIIIVLGSHREEIVSQIGNRSVNYCVNESFMEGMLSSVICGYRALPENAGATLIFLGDQPQIPKKVSNIVIEAWHQNDKGIVIPTFKGKRGHPCLIETKYRYEIEQLDPEKGLRMLAQKFKNDVFEVECNIPEILRDIDTPEEYKQEINKI
jgi:molybdenum cofactor cytidylyltransferase